MLSVMEEVSLRFSHLSEKIFASLDNESITKCRKVSKFWQNYLDNKKFVQIRKINAIVASFHTIGESWKNVLDTSSTATIMDLALAIGKFYKKAHCFDLKLVGVIFQILYISQVYLDINNLKASYNATFD